MAVIGDLREGLLMKILKNIEKDHWKEINYHIYTEKEFKEKLRPIRL